MRQMLSNEQPFSEVTEFNDCRIPPGFSKQAAGDAARDTI